MMRRLSLLAALMIVASIAVPARAAGQPVVLTAPGSTELGYTTRTVVAQPGTSITLLNLDAAFHTLESEAFGPDSNPWCGPIGPGTGRRYPLGKCPLFWTDLALPLGGSRPILGVEAVAPGKAYGFFCRVFEGRMSGVLITL